MPAPLVAWVATFFGVLITNPVSKKPLRLVLEASTLNALRADKKRARRRFRDEEWRLSPRRAEVALGVELERKRAGQCNHGNCPNHATYTLLVVSRYERSLIESSAKTSTPWLGPKPRALCDAHGEMLHELFAALAADSSNSTHETGLFGAEIELRPIQEAA